MENKQQVEELKISFAEFWEFLKENNRSIHHVFHSLGGSRLSIQELLHWEFDDEYKSVELCLGQSVVGEISFYPDAQEMYVIEGERTIEGKADWRGECVTFTIYHKDEQGGHDWEMFEVDMCHGMHVDDEQPDKKTIEERIAEDLNQQLEEARAEQAARLEDPQVKKLHRRLLYIGGTRVSPQRDPHLKLVLKRGKRFQARDNTDAGPGEQNRCHENVARLWMRRHQNGFKVVTGYYLPEDGVWRPHTWGVEKGRVIETAPGGAEKAQAGEVSYFGVELNNEETARFVMGTLSPAEADLEAQEYPEAFEKIVKVAQKMVKN